jgi:hypothetical protein
LWRFVRRGRQGLGLQNRQKHSFSGGCGRIPAQTGREYQREHSHHSHSCVSACHLDLPQEIQGLGEGGKEDIGQLQEKENQSAQSHLIFMSVHILLQNKQTPI